MPIFKNEDTKTWYVMARYTDWKGERKQKCKRGFATRKEALDWEREFLQQKQADVEMPFDSFVELYKKDIKPRLKENTWLTKRASSTKRFCPTSPSVSYAILRQKMLSTGRMKFAPSRTPEAISTLQHISKPSIISSALFLTTQFAIMTCD